MNVGDLIKYNQAFNHQHGLTEKEVEIAEKHIAVINERQRARRLPQAGDLVEGVYWDKYPYSRGLIVIVKNEVVEVCYQPYVPFISTGTGEIYLSVSGGPFTHAHISCFELVAESEERLFCDWGKCGPCANGAFGFPASVKRWKLTENIRIGRDDWSDKTITYEIRGSKHFKAATVGIAAMAGETLKVQRIDGSWFTCEYLGGGVAPTIQKLEYEIEMKG